MLKLLKNRCSFCSKPVDKTHAARAHSTPSHEAVGSSKSKSEWSERGPIPPRPGVEPIERNPDNNPKNDEPRPADAGYSSCAQPVTGPAFPARAAMLFQLLSGSATPAQSDAGEAPPKQPVAAPPCRKTNGYAFAPQSPHAFLTLNLPRFLLSNFAVCGIFSQ